MRYFLYTYSLPDNFVISQRAGVFGAPKNHAGLMSKFLKLRRGDLIIIRDGRKKWSLSFFGYCRVVGETFDHDRYSPFKDFLWPDEQTEQKVIYPLRVAVDFVDVPKLRLENVTWRALDDLRFGGTKWFQMQGKPPWAKKFSGNFIHETTEIEAFSKLVGLNRSQLCTHERFPKRCFDKLSMTTLRLLAASQPSVSSWVKPRRFPADDGLFAEAAPAVITDDTETPDHALAGDEAGGGVAADGRAYRALCVRRTDHRRNVAVALSMTSRCCLPKKSLMEIRKSGFMNSVG